jgi:hypothetical protein
MDHFRRFPQSPAVRNYDRRFIAGFVYPCILPLGIGRPFAAIFSSPQSGGRGPWARSTDPAGGSKSAKSTGRVEALAIALSLALLRAENLIQFDSVV